MDRLFNWLVEHAARVLDALGGNGTRLRWRWNQRRRDLGESGLKASILWRSARTPHKMCPSCRALVRRGASRCPICDGPVGNVSAPGFTRLLRNLLPGATTATALILLANGFWFVLAVMVLVRTGRDVGFTGVLMFPASFQPTLTNFGALSTSLVLGAGEWWRLIPPIFLHGGLVHFFFNSYILVQLSPTVEEEYGTHRMLTAYLVTGIGGFLTTIVWSVIAGPRVSVGGSGAVLGLMGLLLAYGVRRGGGVGARVKAAIGQYVVYLFLISLLFRGIDQAAHIGGFATGFLLGWVLPYGTYRTRGQAAFWEAVTYLLLIVTVLSWVQVALQFPTRGGP